MTAGDIYTVAGNGTRGFAGDGGPAAGAELNVPGAVAVDGAGNLLIADARQRAGPGRRGAAPARSTGMPMTAGDIYTVAGDGIDGFSGDGGPATSAELSGPAGVAVDGAGNLLIAASGNSRIRVVAGTTGTFYGRAMTAGDIYTVAGGGTSVLRRRRPGYRRQAHQPRGGGGGRRGQRGHRRHGNYRARVVARTHRHVLRASDDRRATSTPSPATGPVLVR